MNRKNILCLGLFVSAMYSAQNGVGIQTANPRGIFHIDGKGDNPKDFGSSLSATQQANDFLIKANSGNVGIGTTDPSTKLVINSDTQGAIKIADGTQLDTRLLTSDANGVGTWTTPSAMNPGVYGTFPASNVFVVSGTKSSNNFTYSNISITLPQGKWVVSLGLSLLTNLNDGSMSWLHAKVRPSSTFMDNYGNPYDPTTEGYKYLASSEKNTGYAANLHGYNKDGTYSQKNFMYGTMAIQVTEATGKTLYLWIENGASWRLNTSASENYFYAFPTN